MSGEPAHGPAAPDARRTALLYSALAALWILLSDWVVNVFASDPRDIQLAATLKGWLFVAVTALLLYALLRRLAGEARVGAGETAPTRWPWVFFALLAAPVIALTVAVFLYNAERLRERELARLQAIADLKVRQIGGWLAERRHDAAFVGSSEYMTELYRRWHESKDAAAGKRLLGRFESIREHKGFSAVMLVDAAGRFLLGDHAAHEAAPELRAAIAATSRDRETRRAGPYLGHDGKAQIDFVAPLSPASASTVCLVLHARMDDSLQHALQAWPVPSRTAEALLFRRDGDTVLFLNELRHRPDTALKFRLPLSSPTLLAARVARGEVNEGEIVVGTDYRGVAARGVARQVPGTDWFLLAKMDEVEISAEVNTDAAIIGLAGLLALIAAGIGVASLRQRQALVIAEAMRESQTERLRALQLLAAIADNSEDAIFALDAEGRFIFFNRACESITGKQAADVLGRDERALFPPEVAARQLADNRRVLASGEVLGVEEAVPADDVWLTMLTVKSPLRDEQGRIVGLFGIARDISERKRAEEALRRQSEELARRNEELERFNELTVGRELAMIELKKAVNALSLELGRAPPHDLSFPDEPAGKAAS